MQFTTERKETGNKGAFIAVAEDGTTAGEMTYSWAGKDKFIIDHTEVEERFGGMGVGKIIFESAVAYAREKQVKIMPLCPFAASMFKKSDAYKDVLF